MRQYETMVIIDAMISDDAINAEIETIAANITKGNGEILRRDDWGKRKLAYLINDESEGLYVLFNYQSAPEFPAELDRVVKITDGVLRSLIVKKN